MLIAATTLMSCVATNTRDFAVTPFYSGTVTDAFTGEPLADVLVYVATSRRLPSDAVTVATDANGRFLAGVLGHSAWSVTYANPVEVTCHARITFTRGGYQSQTQEDVGPCTKSPKRLDVSLIRAEPAAAP